MPLADGELVLPFGLILRKPLAVVGDRVAVLVPVLLRISLLLLLLIDEFLNGRACRLSRVGSGMAIEPSLR